MKILCPRRRILPVHSFHRSCPARPALRNLFQVTTVNSRPVFMFLEYPARPPGRADRDAGRPTTVNRNDALTRQRQRRRLRLRITVSDEYQSFLLNRHESRTRPASRGTRCATAALGPKAPETRGPPPSVSRAPCFSIFPCPPSRAGRPRRRATDNRHRNDALTRQRQRRRLRLRITVSDEYQSFLLNRHESRTRPASRGTRCATAALGPKAPETRGPPPSVSRAPCFSIFPCPPSRAGSPGCRGTTPACPCYL